MTIPPPSAPIARKTFPVPNDLRSKVEPLGQAGRWAEALTICDTILKFDPDDEEALTGRVQALLRLGRTDEALAAIWTLIGSGRATVSLWQDASSILFRQERFAEARSVLLGALKLDPGCGRAWGALGEILAKQGKEVAAEACFRRNAALAPEDPLVRLRLAQWLTQAGLYDEALAFFKETLALEPDSLDAVSGLAQVHISQGLLDPAEPFLQRVLARDPQHLDASMGLARLRLLQGDFSAGWPAYEVRRRRKDFKIPKLAGPEWDGSPLSGKILVVYPEQGFGDVIQFLRYTRILYEEGARVIMLVPKELEALSQCLTLFAEISSSLGDLPPYDFHIPLLSLAQYLQAERAIPADVPYLTVEPNPKQKLPVPLGTRLKVGLVWAGRPTHANNRHRSMTLDALMPLAALHGVTLYALQAGPRAKDIHKESHPVLVGDLSPHLKDFVDTARVIRQLDVVVAVDTSVAHLAGALGKPVWVLVPFAPDWRWLLGTEHTEWYPTMRLFRQTTPRRWDDVVERIAAELTALAAGRPELGMSEEAAADSVFPRGDGSARYRMVTPRAYLADAGVGYLFRHERAGVGYEYATRSFLDAHLLPGDLFIDVGAHWGIMSLQAATRWPDIQVLACEPTPRNLPHLQRWIDINGLSDRIEVIPAAIADQPGQGEMLPQSTMGHSLKKNARGAIPVTTIDRLLADRPDLAGRRVIVKIDVEGAEAEVIAGMKDLLASGRVAAIIWERGRTHDHAGVAALRATLGELGFTPWRFSGEGEAGSLLPFENDGRIENIFELSPSMIPRESYGGDRCPREAQPEDGYFEAVERAHKLFQDGLAHQSAGEIDKALSAYALAGTLDRRSPDLFNNLGVALQRLERLPAAEAAYRRASALDPYNSGTLSNLGSVLRERGKLEEAAEIQARAAELAPGNAGIQANAGHAHRDVGRLAEARFYYEKSLALNPHSVEITLELAKCLLKAGDFAEGFRRYALLHSADTPLPGKPWAGKSLKGKSILLNDDGEIEDTLQFARLIPAVVRHKPAEIVLRCRAPLAPLLASLPGIDRVVARGEEMPSCDFHASMRILPALTNATPGTGDAPYIPVPEAIDTKEGRLKIGLQWAAPALRRECSCPLDLLLPLFAEPAYSGFSLQQGTAATELETGGGVELLRDLGPTIGDFAQAVAIVAGLDVLITVDGPLAHLAGAMGRTAFVLLPYSAEWRWGSEGNGSAWYPSLRLFRQHRPDDWGGAIGEMAAALAAISTRGPD